MSKQSEKLYQNLEESKSKPQDGQKTKKDADTTLGLPHHKGQKNLY